MKCSFASKPEYFRKFISESEAISFKILNENLSCIFRQQKVVNLDKPIAMGFVVLERAKLLMYKLYYEQLRPKFNSLRVLYTDTDSFVLELCKKGQDIDKNTFELISEYMDFSNYPEDHVLYDRTKKNQLGLIKDELASRTMTRFVALRSKTYCYEVDKVDFVTKAKGVAHRFHKDISFVSYLECIEQMLSNHLTQYQIRAFNHNVVTQKLSKMSFSSFDDKRFLFPCAIHSVPYGYYLLPIYKDYLSCPICNKSVLS